MCFLLLGGFIGSDGYIAPGMIARFNVRFIPDSLADYYDEIEVKSQAYSPIIVKLYATRRAPALTSAYRFFQCLLKVCGFTAPAFLFVDKSYYYLIIN